MSETAKKKIYCFNNGGSPGWLQAVAIGEDGVVVASHVCSHECYMHHDLGIEGTWKHEAYDAHFGAGQWELVWVSTSEVVTHPGLLAALELNRVTGAAAKSAKAEAVTA